MCMYKSKWKERSRQRKYRRECGEIGCVHGVHVYVWQRNQSIVNNWWWPWLLKHFFFSVISLTDGLLCIPICVLYIICIYSVLVFFQLAAENVTRWLTMWKGYTSYSSWIAMTSSNLTHLSFAYFAPISTLIHRTVQMYTYLHSTFRMLFKWNILWCCRFLHRRQMTRMWKKKNHRWEINAICLVLSIEKKRF